MLGNDDNSSIEINVNKWGNGMSEGTVTIDISEYKQILELAYKAAMLKEAVLNCTTLDFYGKDLYFGGGNGDVASIFKYAFPEDYESKLRELMDEKREKDEKDRLVELMNKKKAEDSKEGADDER